MDWHAPACEIQLAVREIPNLYTERAVVHVLSLVRMTAFFHMAGPAFPLAG